MKKILFITFITFIIFVMPCISALDECGDSVLQNRECAIHSPVIPYCSVYSYNITYSNQSNYANGTMSHFANSIYNFSVNFTQPDTYVIDLCDDSVRVITVLNITATSETPSIWSLLLQIFYNTLPGGY